MTKQKKRQLGRVLSLLMLSLVALATFATSAQAQENCLQCHGEADLTLKRSVHSFLSCTSCHADINGFPHPAGASLDKKESVIPCANCHKGQIADSYKKSFHGKAVHLGSQRSASCADCHGAHDVLGADYPLSKVAEANVAQTCASCHDQASPGFKGTEHFTLAPKGPGAPMYYTAKFFEWLTLIVITALVIHIELQLYHNLRTILRERKRG